MNRVLFVSNGHGEIAIAARIALSLQSRGPIPCDHLALVGDFDYPSAMREVGPRRAMPSGGVIAMGNVRNIVRDVRAGLLTHTLSQVQFLRRIGRTYGAAVAVGDIFALAMARQARARATVFVGTAKSVFVAPYGSMEERLMRGTDAVFVRDAATAQRLAAHGIAAVAANAIVDLYERDGSAIDVPFDPLLAIFPGSREPAYADAVSMARAMRGVAEREMAAGALLSIAPGIDAERMREALRLDGWSVEARQEPHQPFALLLDGREVVRAWQGPLGAMLSRAALVLGQAGTANEAAAAMGIPVIAFARSGEQRTPWYRMRQIGLLGDAMIVASADPDRAAAEIIALLHEPARRERMAREGRERMGGPGGSDAIAERIAQLVSR